MRPPPVAAPPIVTPPVTPPHEQQRRAIPFVAQLKRMIEERPEIIRWRRGDIVIPDPTALERNLSKYYKHSKYEMAIIYFPTLSCWTQMFCTFKAMGVK